MPFSFKLSERAQVVTILILAVVALALAWHFLLRSQFDQRARNRQTRDDLKNSPFANLTIESLNKIAAVEKAASAALDADWARTARRLTTIPDIRPDQTHIDFVVTYAATHKTLEARAKSRNITLPPGLGVPSGITSTEVVRERFVQLKTVEKLVDLVMDQHIRGIRGIKILPTVLHYGTDQKLICEEFPVEVDFSTHFDSLFDLFSGIFEEDRVFVFNKIRVASDPTNEDVLHIKANLSSLVFP